LFIEHALTELESLRFMLNSLNYKIAFISSWSLWNSQSSKNVQKKFYTCFIFGYTF